jgi:thiol-disulfide isomerase/thioredoxin
MPTCCMRMSPSVFGYKINSMRWWLVILAAAVNVQAYWFGSGVDYFGTGKREEKREEKKEEKKEEVKKEDKEKYYEELYRKAQEWFPETTNPLERAFYKNPDDPKLIELLHKFYTERQERANQLASKLIALQSQEDAKLLEKLRNYVVVYFYSPQCPYCRASEQYLASLEGRAKQLLKVNILLPENAGYVKDFGVQATPTLVFMKDGKVVKKWVGVWVYPSQGTTTFLRELP